MNKEQQQTVQTVFNSIFHKKSMPVALEDNALVFGGLTISDKTLTRRTIGREIEVPGFLLDKTVRISLYPTEPDTEDIVEVCENQNFGKIVIAAVMEYSAVLANCILENIGIEQQIAEEKAHAQNT